MTHYFYRKQHPVRETMGQLAMIVSLIVAIAYPFHIIPFNPIFVKGSAVGLLALYTLFRIRELDHFLLFMVLIANALGDMLIEQSETNALFNAMKSFMVGHVLLIFVFIRNSLSISAIDAKRSVSAALLWIIATIAGYLLWPELPTERNQILIYAIAILAMTTTAFFSRFSFKLVGLGTIFYIISDSLIAAQLFFQAPSWLSHYTWSFYYVAQLMITVGILFVAKRDSDRPRL